MKPSHSHSHSFISATVMGIDPGLSITGYGLIRGDRSRITLIESGAIRTNSSQGLPARLKQLYTGLNEVMTTYKPDHVAIEQIFLAQNVSSAMKLGQARGVALMTAFACGAEIGEYSAIEVKKAVVGVGRASKEQVQIMVQHLLALKNRPEPADVADALAVAICHLHTIQSLWPKQPLRNRRFMR
ncbi:crossover junction endodeoxyribonuclease RuvC [bacterium]|nr:crossover junction endodeoxyribonuclease RuvC [bacterium]